MTSGASPAKSAACLRMSAAFPPAQRSVDPRVAADVPAQLPQPLQERPEAGLKFRIIRGCGQKYADAPHPLGLLRARGKRPRSCRAAQQPR